MEPTNIHALMSSIFSRWNMKLDQKQFGFEFSHEHFSIFVIWRLILFLMAVKQMNRTMCSVRSLSLQYKQFYLNFATTINFERNNPRMGTNKMRSSHSTEYLYMRQTQKLWTLLLARISVLSFVFFLLFDGNESVFLSCFVCLKLKFSPRMDAIGLLAHCKKAQTSRTNVKAHTMLVELQTV